MMNEYEKINSGKFDPQTDSKISLLTDLFQSPITTQHKAAQELAKAKQLGRITPMMAQYLEIKAANPDCLLFYRMGDFFELFFDDAEIASRALGIMLTKRGKHEGLDIPMCGVPVERSDDYLQKLIALGHRVAVCEQMEEASEAKKRGAKSVVKRDVTRLITPGTVVEDNLLEPGQSNFLVALVNVSSAQAPEFGLAAVELSTGLFQVETLQQEGLSTELARLQPKEILVNDNMREHASVKQIFQNTAFHVTNFNRPQLGALEASQHLCAFYHINTLMAFGEFSNAEVMAASFLLSYLERTQLAQKPLLRPLTRIYNQNFMQIDAATRANLELTRTQSGEYKGSVLETIARTQTSSGARLLAQDFSAPLLHLPTLNARLDAVGYFVNAPDLRRNLHEVLKQFPDCERALARLALNRAGPRDVFAIAKSLSLIQSLSESLAQTIIPAQVLREILETFEQAPIPLQQTITAALTDELPLLIRDGGFVRQGYDIALDDARMLRDQTREFIAKLQQKYSADLSVLGIKQVRIKFNNFIGYYLELPQIQGDKLLQAPWLETYIHRQTMSDAMRFSTSELVELERKISNATHEALQLELKIFETLRQLCLEQATTLHRLVDCVARLDVCVSLAELASQQNYVRPKLYDDITFEIKNGRHLVVEHALQKQGQKFISNDCTLSAENELHGLIIVMTGPNMAGKSTFLRQNALIAILAQIGSFVPADEAHIGLVDQLFSRVGASDDLARGRSTFMVEMVETAAILNQARNKALVIVDEIGRGTATYDGLSIAWAVMEYLHNVCCCRALFATHYHELTKLSADLPRVRNLTLQITEWQGEIVFLHKVASGSAKKSYGIDVAKLAGLPSDVIRRARDILVSLEEDKTQGDMVDVHSPVSYKSEPVSRENIKPEGMPKPDVLQQKLMSLSVDDLTPKSALDLLYELKSLVQK